jgi:hypothetical protein
MFGILSHYLPKYYNFYIANINRNIYFRAVFNIYYIDNMWATILGQGLNVVANAIGTAVANKRIADARAQYDAEYNAQQQALENEINSNYLDRADSRAALRAVTDSNTEAMRQLNTNAIRGGASDEAKVAAASQLNKRTADVVSDIAAMGEQYKDSLKQQKRALSLSKAEHDFKMNSDVSGIESIMKNIGAAAANIGSAWTENNANKTTPPELEKSKTIMENANTTLDTTLNHKYETKRNYGY